MTFREMTVEDLEQVVEIENRLFSDPWTKEGFFTFLTKENTMFFVIEEKEKILAYCSMQTVLDEGDILNVAVSPDRQREGIGYFLVDSMLKMAEMIGIHIVHLEVREGNGTARRLYERLGFKEDGLRKNYYTDCHHKANVKKPERRRKQTYEEKICSFYYDSCDERGYRTLTDHCICRRRRTGTEHRDLPGWIRRCLLESDGRTF